MTSDRATAALPDASVRQRRLQQVRALLAGESVDMTRFAYEFEAHHVGVVARGPGAPRVTEALAEQLGCRRLVVEREDGVVWAWLGRRRRPELDRLDRLGRVAWLEGVALAVGEVGHGLAGWRRTHRQARAASLVARRAPGRVVRYGDVALLASMAQDDLLARSLHELYLAPLADERDGGATLRRTLRAYFATGRNGASAAAALNVSRQTVSNRLHSVESRIGRPLSECATAIEAALKLEELSR